MNSKINGKFYPLKHSEWLIACRELTPSKRDVLYYLRTLDPYGDGVEINCAEIARQLSSERRNISRQTVSRAIKELDAKGFIDAEISRANVTIKPKGLWCAQTPSVREDTKGVPRHQRCAQTPSVREDTTRCAQTPQGVLRHHPKSETPKQQDFQISKTNTDFKDSLSDSEREKNSVSQKEEITRSEKTSNDFSHSNLNPSSSSSNSLVSDKNLGLDQKRRRNHSLTKSLNSHITSPNSAHRKAPQTYSDFIQTLSDGEREKFLDFVTEQIKDFAQPINDVEAWLANFNKAGQNRWEVYYSKFVSSSKPIVSAAPVNPLTEQIMRRREEAMKRLTEERANLHGVQ